ncbi:hypothetical protein HWV62_4916 [Athelia sp. TMB]|nr:hypothetical protein HWV62_4916 [Athelia sp. TMB]
MSTICLMLVSPVLFVWKTLKLLEKRDKHAEYCVFFHAQSGPPFSALMTAYILLKFPQQWSTRTGQKSVPLQIAFAIDDTGSWGFMTFDSTFSHTFDLVFNLGITKPSKYRAPGGEDPITVWPESKHCTHFRNERMIARTLNIGRAHNASGNLGHAHKAFCVPFQTADDELISDTGWTLREAKTAAHRITALFGVPLGRAGAELMGLNELIGQENTIDDLREIAFKKGVKIPINERDVSIEWDFITPILITDPALGIDSGRLLKIRNSQCSKWNGEHVAPSILMVFQVKGLQALVTSTVVQSIALRPIYRGDGSPVSRGLHDKPYSVDVETTIAAVKKAWWSKFGEEVA